MIDWTYIIQEVIIMVIVSIIFTLLQKTMKIVVTGIAILILFGLFSGYMINQDLKNLEDSTFVLKDGNETLSILVNGSLVEDIPSGRILIFNASDFKIDKENTFDKLVSEKLSGNEKENKKYLLDNAESMPETAGYRLKFLAKLMLI